MKTTAGGLEVAPPQPLNSVVSASIGRSLPNLFLHTNHLRLCVDCCVLMSELLVAAAGLFTPAPYSDTVVM
jgi:hypothetical protein